MTRTFRPAQRKTDVSKQQVCDTLRKWVACRAFNLKIWQPLRQLHVTGSLDAPTLERLLQAPCDVRSNEDPFSVSECDASSLKRCSAYRLRATTAITHDRFLTLLHAHPPRNAKACAGYLKDRMRVVLHRSQIYPHDGRLPEHQYFFRTVFFPRLLVIIERIASTEDGALPVLDLCVYAKLDCLHGYFPFFCNEAHQHVNRQIDSLLMNALHSVRKHRKASGKIDSDAQARQPDAAFLCQSIRRFCTHYSLCDPASTSSLYDQRQRGCVHVNTAVVLDLLQRHAYTETKLNVYRVVGRILPKELADMILRYVLLSQGQPEEPGIFDQSGKAVLHCEDACTEVLRTELV
jgi:hypothetical protein